ncbi:U7 snRNA-associated Sm-like protein LSm11 [Megalops cyprinoides]|uniref:U7 snRNA-associated Sm-like protein LSm11 n=1 Tax=Megalops cyprinoides TaxID=118141 RepID=UPI001864BECD|nr:U7 snRNA-associated Sm-like protein LSm11 [Megalops cyprinoides]
MEEREREIGDKKCLGRQTGEIESTSSVPDRPTTAAEGGSDRKAEDEIDSKLDVSSDQFDPLLALYSPQVPLPYPNIKCFNNIAEYESFLKGGRGRAKPENVEKRLRKAQKGVPDPERIERLKKLMVNVPSEEAGSSGNRRPPRKQKAAKNVLTRMPLHKGSPLGELHRCVQERIRVKVHIRTFKGLRGVCSGFVVAFDKFWNMAMVDVDETYRKPLLGEALHHDRALTVTRLFDRLKLQDSPESCGAEQKKSSSGHAQGKGITPKEPAGDTPTPHLRRSPRKGVRADARSAPAGEGAPNRGGEGRTAVSERRGSRTEKGPREKASQPKVDYQWVHTRHINQLFIRGENVLLVNLH